MTVTRAAQLEAWPRAATADSTSQALTWTISKKRLSGMLRIHMRLVDHSRCRATACVRRSTAVKALAAAAAVPMRTPLVVTISFPPCPVPTC
jgi:hypothetical protein